MIQPCVIRKIERPAPDLVRALSDYGVATIHEAYRQQGLMRPEIRPVVPGRRVCGPAVTSLNHPGDNLMLHVAIEVSQPGDIIVVATKAPSTDGMLGELIATQCKARGLSAVILDAGVRDSADLNAMDFPVWARAISAAGTSKANPGWVNVPVVCGGVTVNPGDLVVADDDGVVVVGRSDAAAVLEASRARTEKEALSRSRYERGEISLDVNNLRAILTQLGVKYFETADEAQGRPAK